MRRSVQNGRGDSGGNCWSMDCAIARLNWSGEADAGRWSGVCAAAFAAPAIATNSTNDTQKRWDPTALPVSHGGHHTTTGQLPVSDLRGLPYFRCHSSVRSADVTGDCEM